MMKITELEQELSHEQQHVSSFFSNKIKIIIENLI